MMLKNQIYIFILTALLGCMVGLMGGALRIMIAHTEHLFSLIANYSHYPVIAHVGIAMLMVYLAWWMVKHIAPEASGSGVHEIEGYLTHVRGIYWKRLIPVKFVGGVIVLASKMLLGREGPTIQLGGNFGAMISDKFQLDQEVKDSLIAAGAAAGLATAFNAPLAGILFVTEEMRKSCQFSIFRFKQILTCVVSSTILNYYILGGAPQIPMPSLSLPHISSVFMFLVLGLIIGLFGWIYNVSTMRLLFWTDRLTLNQQKFFILSVAALIGLLTTVQPNLVGEGYFVIEQTIGHNMPVSILMGLFVGRFILGLMCYGMSTPGGIFSPMLALGTLLGLIIFNWFYDVNTYLKLSPEMFAVAGMSALFSATIQAPITGILLVIELTHNYDFILPLMVASLTACMVAQLEKNPAIYTRLLDRVLMKSQKSSSRGL